MDKRKRFVLLLTPDDAENSKKTIITIREVSPELSLDEMYELIDCRCIGIGYLSDTTVPQAVFNYSPILVYDDEYLLVNEPKVNYAASVLMNTPVCGNVLIVQDYEDDEGEKNSRGFLPQEAVKIRAYIDVLNHMTDQMPNITPPEPHMEFRSFNSDKEFMEFLNEQKR